MFSAKRLKQIRMEKNQSQVEIANQLGINRSSYHSWESGRAIPNKKHLDSLASIFGVPSQYFESEYDIVADFLQLTKLRQEKASQYVKNLLNEQKQEGRPLLFPIPVIKNVALAAGHGFGFDDEYETETVYSSKEFSGYDLASWIKGDSMLPTYKDGEVALIQKTGFDYDGLVYALVWNEKTYIKKLYKEEKGIRMVSINNEKYSDCLIPMEDEYRIVGKVIGHFLPEKEDKGLWDI